MQLSRIFQAARIHFLLYMGLMRSSAAGFQACMLPVQHVQLGHPVQHHCNMLQPVLCPYNLCLCVCVLLQPGTGIGAMPPGQTDHYLEKLGEHSVINVTDATEENLPGYRRAHAWHVAQLQHWARLAIEVGRDAEGASLLVIAANLQVLRILPNGGGVQTIPLDVQTDQVLLHTEVEGMWIWFPMDPAINEEGQDVPDQVSAFPSCKV